MSFNITLPKPVARIPSIIACCAAVLVMTSSMYGCKQQQSQKSPDNARLDANAANRSATEAKQSPGLWTTMPAVAFSGTEPPPPPMKAQIISINPGRGIVWLSAYGETGHTFLRWNPANGDAVRLNLATNSLPGISDFSPYEVLDIRNGVLILGLKKGLTDPVVGLLTTQDEFRSTTLKAPRSDPNLLELHDGSVLVSGGIARHEGKERKFSNAVELIKFTNDALLIERLPDIPGENRRGISMVELSDGRVMALGGSWSQYVGSDPMTAETYFLDLARKAWQKGPNMIEARANATATLLSDGSMLVAGGWTPKNTWNDAPTRNTELWSPRANSFASASPLPIGIAGHQAMWLSGRQGRLLLLAGGWVKAWEGNQSVLALDAENGSWRMVGEPCSAEGRTGELKAAAFEFNGRPYVWCQTSVDFWNLVSLRLPQTGGGTSLPRIDPEKGIALRRYGMAFLPPHANHPGLAVGGAINGADTAAVDAIWLDGRIQALAPLNHARRQPLVFRLLDGSFLVASGEGGDTSRHTQHVPPFELLPAGVPIEKARWIDVDYDAKDIAAMTMLKDGSLLAVHSAGNVERLTITVSQGKPAVQRNTFPPLNRKRSSSPGNGDEVLVRELPDGRIVVAGGWVQYHRIALLDEDSSRADAPDHFVGIGESALAHWHEIYDPATKSWSESFPSRRSGGKAAILDDGRVVTWGKMDMEDPWRQGAESSSNGGKAALEISDSDGKAWGPPKERTPPLIATDIDLELFTIDGELFLFGKRPADVTPDYWRGNPMVQWFNTSTAGWETIWESGANDNWYRDHVGRIIIRKLPNGTRIALPVAGLSGKGSGG